MCGKGVAAFELLAMDAIIFIIENITFNLYIQKLTTENFLYTQKNQEKLLYARGKKTGINFIIKSKYS